MRGDSEKENRIDEKPFIFQPYFYPVEESSQQTFTVELETESPQLYYRLYGLIDESLHTFIATLTAQYLSSRFPVPQTSLLIECGNVGLLVCDMIYFHQVFKIINHATATKHILIGKSIN